MLLFQDKRNSENKGTFDTASFRPFVKWVYFIEKHKIEITNEWEYLFWGRERLYIDGKIADEHEGYFTWSTNLFGKLQIDNTIVNIKVEIGQSFRGVTCKVWLNDVMVPLKKLRN